MILRQIITTNECQGWVFVNLECGHQVGPLSNRRVPKHRKRCVDCEGIAAHRNMFPNEHRSLMGGLRRVPMDDRATALVEWINHLHRARQLICMGFDSTTAVALTEQPTSYPLWRMCFDEDDEPSFY